MSEVKISQLPVASSFNATDEQWQNNGGVSRKNTLTQLFGDMFAAVGQLAFPVTKEPSDDPNTLDTYEEGTWTPTLTFATPGNLSVTYTVQIGRYQRFGKRVWVEASIETATFTHTTASGDLRIVGLPFDVDHDTTYTPGGGCAFQGITKASYAQFYPVPQGNTDYCLLQCSGSGQNVDTVDTADMPTGTTKIIRMAISYEGEFPAGPEISIAPSRLSGVAPLAVLFDASGTTDSTTDLPFHELGYSWDFGDDPLDTWDTTGRSKNIAYGAVAAHVFNDPGTYTVTLTVTNGADTSVGTVDITVDDPDVTFLGTNTVYVSSSALPVAGSDGVPFGATYVFSGDWPTIVNTYATAGKRVLLRHDDTFTGTATAVLPTGSTGIIGMYGSGAKPIIRNTGTTNNSSILRPPTSAVADRILMDLDFDGQSDTHRNGFFAFANFRLSQLLFLRCDFHDLGGGITITADTLTPVVPDQIFLVDSTIERINCSSGTAGPQGVFFAGSQLGVLGNTLNDSTGSSAEHLLRIKYCDRGVVSDNSISNVATNKEMFSLRGVCTDGTCGPFPVGAKTQYVVVSYNIINTNTYSGTVVDTEATAGTAASIENVLIEANVYYRKTGGGADCIEVRAHKVTVRNNIAEMTIPAATAVVPFIVVGTGGLGTYAQDVWVYNNSAYSNGTQTAVLVRITNTNVTGLVVRNNILYRPNAGAPTKVQDLGSGNSYTESNNLITNPTFVVQPPVTAANFALGSGSVAIDAGYAVPVWYDYDGEIRPAGAAIDQGAFES